MACSNWDEEMDVYCRACNSYYVKPTVLIKCGHTLCKDCWDKRLDSQGKIVCLHCEVKAERRHLRMDFNKQKEVEEFIKDQYHRELQDFADIFEELKITASSLESASIANKSEINGIQILHEIAKSEQCMTEMVRERHQELRDKVKIQLLRPAGYARDGLYQTQSIQREAEAQLEIIAAMESRLFEAKSDSNFKESFNKFTESCETMSREYQETLDYIESKRYVSIETDFKPADSVITKDFLNTNCTIEINVSYNPADDAEDTGDPVTVPSAPYDEQGTSEHTSSSADSDSADSGANGPLTRPNTSFLNIFDDVMGIKDPAEHKK